MFDIRRGIDNKEKEHGKIVNKEKLIPTQRYIFFNGSRTDKKEMKKHFKLKSFPYPKGENKKYNASYECQKVKLEEIINT